jgi:hypothetical protein
VPWLRRSVASLSPRRPGFHPGPVHVGFMVDKVALGPVFPRELRFSPANFNPPVLHYTDRQKIIIFITKIAQSASRLIVLRALYNNKNRSTLKYATIASFQTHANYLFTNPPLIRTLHRLTASFSEPSRTDRMYPAIPCTQSPYKQHVSNTVFTVPL